MRTEPLHETCGSRSIEMTHSYVQIGLSSSSSQSSHGSRSMKRIFTALSIAFVLCVPSAQASEISERMGAEGLKATLAYLKTERPENHFAIGLIGTLAAVEGTMQTRWRHNIGDGVLNMPLLRTPIAMNPNPEPKRPEVFAGMMRQFLEDIEVALTALDTATHDPDTHVVIRPADLWFDVNRDGVRGFGEGAVETIGALMQRSFRQNIRNDEFLDVEIRFDAADNYWLLAYANVLSGIANTVLAFDPTPVFAKLDVGVDTLLNATERQPLLSIAQARQELSRIQSAEDRMDADAAAAFTSTDRQRLSDLRRQLRNPDNSGEPNREAIQLELEELQAKSEAARSARREAATLRAELRAERADVYAKSYLSNRKDPMASIRELADYKSIYVLIESLAQQPNAEHLSAALDNFRQMIAENRQFWAKLKAERDNDREWIANDNQQAALGFETPEGAPEQLSLIHI